MSDQPDKKPDNDVQLAGKIKDSARQIWLAGLGAYTKAEEDAGRFFERLVHEGEELESKTRGVVKKQVRSVEHRVEDVRERATGTWDRLENLFDERVSGALRRLGIHRREDIEALERRIESLEAELRELKSKGSGPAPRKRTSAGKTQK
ncbi:MAG: phasin family protein [Marinobacter sp.]|uniref:phasin family protein n=1 Tax=Marinobacter sp. TaxID=50741 RepID=UPI00299E1AF3|nr:phasin family protein [Marinobacter sp.]MDX1634355.1 phasin family protein [Marinobacter sp.]